MQSKRNLLKFICLQNVGGGARIKVFFTSQLTASCSTRNHATLAVFDQEFLAGFHGDSSDILFFQIAYRVDINCVTT
jgi:hypothetical protein